MRKLIPCLAMLVATFSLAPSGVSEAAPVGSASAQKKPLPQKPPPIQKAAPPKTTMKRLVKMTTQNVLATVGETRGLQATLTLGESSNGLLGKPVTFKLSKEGAPVLTLGTATTNGNGKATLPWKFPEVAQAQYTLTAEYAGDEENRAATDDAPCYIAKANTVFDATYNYGALDSHGGPKFGTVSIFLRRKSDNETIAKPIQVSVDGTRTEYMARTGTPIVITLPDEKDVYVKMEFAGDASNHATMFHDRYQL
jgi:hypothetical protein